MDLQSLVQSLREDAVMVVFMNVLLQQLGLPVPVLPTLLLAGADDPVTTVADAQAMQASIAGSSLAVVPASHLSNLEAPQAFEQAVLDFLAHAAKA